MKRERVEAILGDVFFPGLQKFYKQIQESEYPYKVCLVRRSFVLGEIFFNIVEGNHSENAFNSCITDSALISLCPELAEYFLKNHHFPDILIADDILIHGRALNAFLVRLEDELIRDLKMRDPKLEDDVIRTELAYAVNIRVYVKSDKPSLLLVRYQARVKCERVEKEVVWRNLSNRISVLISESGLANANYVLSNLVQQKEITDSDSKYHKICTFYRGSSETAFIRVLDFGNGPKAVLTVRYWETKQDQEIRAIPFVFLPEISANVRNTIMQEIDTRLKEKGCKEFSVLNWANLYRISNEFISMVLSQNLWFIFAEERNIPIANVELENVEISKIARNYGNSSQVSQLIKFIKSHPLFTEDEFIHLIERATVESDYLFEHSKREISEPEIKALLDVMEKIIFEESLDSEWEAYCLKNETYMPSKLQYREAKMKINSFWKKIADQAQSFFSIYYVAAYTLQFMDLGIMVLSVYKSYGDDEKEYCQYAKAGEQSLMLESLKLYEYIPLLSAMHKKCSIGGRDIKQELRLYCQSFYIPQKDCQNMMKYLDDLDKIGQTVDDWDFNMLIRVYRDYDKNVDGDFYLKIKRDIGMANRQRKYVSDYLG